MQRARQPRASHLSVRSHCASVADLRPINSKVIREAAARILPYIKGDFKPAGPPAPFQAITDELLVVAEEAVACVCAAVLPAPPSLAAQQRLLAWVVA